MTRPPLHPAWRDLRRRRLLALGSFLAFFPLVALVGRVLGGAAPFSPLFLLWGVVYSVAAFRLMFFPCPACGRPFFLREWWNGDRGTSNCMHCGLPKDADPTVRAALRLKSNRLRL